jgi:hypothetical protein
MGELLVATGDHRFFAQLGRILGQRAVSVTVERTDSRAAVVDRMDAIWKRCRCPIWERPAILLHLPDNHPDYDPHWLAAGDAVIDAEGRALATVIKLRNADDRWKSISLAGRRAAIVDRF